MSVIFGFLVKGRWDEWGERGVPGKRNQFLSYVPVAIGVGSGGAAIGAAD